MLYGGLLAVAVLAAATLPFGPLSKVPLFDALWGSPEAFAAEKAPVPMKSFPSTQRPQTPPKPSGTLTHPSSGPSTGPGQTGIFMVNVTTDGVDTSPGDGQCFSAEIGGKKVCTLRAAIMEANALPGSHTIQLPPGVFILTIPGPGEDASRTGDLDITGHLTINGTSSAGTIIDANGIDRVFHILASATVTISNMMIRNGRRTIMAGDPGPWHGAGIWNAGNLKLDHVTIIGNKAQSGAGIFNKGGVAITNSNITGNAAEDGGGIRNDVGGTLTITDSRVSGNFSEGQASGVTNLGNLTIIRSNINDNAGSGVLNDGANSILNIRNSTIANNKALWGGGGVSNYKGTVTIMDTKIIGNSCKDENGTGGGIYNHDGSATLIRAAVSGNSCSYMGGGIANALLDHPQGGELIVADSTISGNSALHAAGISNYGRLILTNSTLTDNIATWTGGAISQRSWPGIGAPAATAVLTNVTIANNKANSGGGIFNDPSAGSTIELRNTIVAYSPLGGNCSGGLTITSSGNNLEDGNTCGFTNASIGDRNSADPKLGPLADNGGPTQTRALLPGSPAIDAGSLSRCPATDQRGVTRPRDGNGDGYPRCDIGAFER